MATKTAAKKSARKSSAKANSAKTSAKQSAAKTFKPGDKVAWDTSQGATHGKVVRKQTTPTQIKTHKVAASPDNPQYIVESDKSGKQAAHKPGELRKQG
jgi:plastocyanin